MTATTSLRRPITAIDSHAHVMALGRSLSDERHSQPSADHSVDDFLAVLDAHGVSHGLLTAPSFYGTDNTMLLDAIAASGGRLRGTAIVDPELGLDALRDLQSHGVCGVRLNWIRRDALPDIESAAYRGLLARLRELGLHLEIYLEGPKLATVLPVVRASGVTLVLDHFGSPDPKGGVDGAAFRAVLDAVAEGRTWVKLSGPYRLGGTAPKPYADALLKVGGPERLVWATDWPWISHEGQVTYSQCQQWLHDWIPDPVARHTVLVDTPAALFGFKNR